MICSSVPTVQRRGRAKNHINQYVKQIFSGISGIQSLHFRAIITLSYVFYSDTDWSVGSALREYFSLNSETYKKAGV